MRLVSYIPQDGSQAADCKGRTAVVTENGLIDLNRTDPGLPTCMRKLLKMGPDALDKAREVGEKGEAFSRDMVQLLAPVPRPGKIVCIGANYADHARESGIEPPSEPVVFNKFPTAVLEPGGTVMLPPVSDRVDYEAELVVILCRQGKNIPIEDALDYVAGYTCGNDISARDWQKGKPAKQWLLGKTFDTFAPFGPELVTKDEVGDPGQLNIQLRLNGETMQKSRTDLLIFSVPFLISYISQICTFEPGDVLFTGTPQGVGAARTPPVFLQDGDETEVEIEKIGILRNKVQRNGAS
jgi:2-keto-4-pentenoate hydratase/2-oxohepta-3-ene-1,7-dioic acid hydratase in catechol pathway